MKRMRKSIHMGTLFPCNKVDSADEVIPQRFENLELKPKVQESVEVS